MPIATSRIATPMSSRGPVELPVESCGAEPTSTTPISARTAGTAAVMYRRALSWLSCTLLATHSGGTHDANPPVAKGRAKNQKRWDFHHRVVAGVGGTAGVIGAAHEARQLPQDRRAGTVHGDCTGGRTG